MADRSAGKWETEDITDMTLGKPGLVVITEYGHIVCDMPQLPDDEDRANAQAIVRAVNAHDDLVAMLTELVGLPGVSSLAADANSDAVIRAAKLIRQIGGEPC